MAIPASLIEVKGHKYLIEAIAQLAATGIRDFKCFFYGDGNLRAALINDIKKRNLEGVISIPGALPHDRLIALYRDRKIDSVVLPSINTDSGEHEGIPVSLMEAMAYGIPVISTNTGAIPELLSDGAGIVVPEKSPTALAEALRLLMADSVAAKNIGRVGREKVENDFNIEKNTRKLLALIQKTHE